MSNKQLVATLIALVLVLGAAAAGAEEPTQWQFKLTFAGQYKNVSGERDSKFEEYRDLPNGALVEDAALEFLNPASPWSFLLAGDHLGRRDESAALSWARAGRFRLDAKWNRTPHFLSRGATSLWGGSQRGVLELADSLQNSIESFFTASPTPTTDQARGFMSGVIDQWGRKIDLRTQRDTAKVRLAFDLTEHWDLAVYSKSEKKSGTGRIGTGTYIRRQTANSFDRNRFEPRGNELPLPIDYQTEDWGFGSGWRSKSWFFDVGWQQSSFANDTGTLTFDNPFEGPPGATSSLTGNNPNFEQEPSGATANTNNRGRFVRSQLDLYPDNEFERLYLTGALNLPGRTRLNASYASAKMTQDDSFLPYTLNEAVIFSNGPDGIGGTADDVLAKNVALPRGSLDGEIQTTRLDLKLTSRPIDALALRGSYRKYEYEDDTATVILPGFAAAGDSYFRPGVGQRDAAGVRILFSDPGGYSRTSWTVGGAWSFGKPATVDLEYGSTEWEYEERQVESTSEDFLAAKLRLAFGERFEARLSYLDSSRDAEGPYAIGFETSRVRAFDVWNRDRTRFGGEFSFALSEHSHLGFSYQNWKDEYPGVLPEPVPPSSANPFPSLPYGLNETQNESWAAHFGTGSEDWNFSASLGMDNSEWISLAVAKTSLTGDSPQFDPVNRWVRNQDDDILWAALAFDAKLGAKGKLIAELDYHDYDGDYRTTNPGTPNVNDGFAYAMPGFSSSLFSGKLSFEWALREHFDLAVSYLYEPYRLDDWQWDLVQPYMQGVLKETGGSPATVRDNAALRWLFMDATYSDYTASVFTVALKIRY